MIVVYGMSPGNEREIGNLVFIVKYLQKKQSFMSTLFTQNPKPWCAKQNFI